MRSVRLRHGAALSSDQKYKGFIVASRKILVLALLGGTAWTPLLAQQAPPDAAPAATPAPPAAAPSDADDEDEAEGGETIVVTGQRPRGAVIGDIQPEVQFDRREIRALGAGSLSELLDAIAPQTQSGR